MEENFEEALKNVNSSLALCQVKNKYIDDFKDDYKSLFK